MEGASVMRLFLAILFEEPVKDRLCEAMELIRRLREAVPDLALRTTLLVGYPGETEDDFAQLLDFAREVRFERLGVFAYSEEEGTYSARELRDDVPEAVKQERVERVMALQNGISPENNRRRVGRTERVIIDSRQGDFYVGRTQYDSPEVDQEILIPAADRRLLRGRFYDVRITSAADYDLYGETSPAVAGRRRRIRSPATKPAETSETGGIAERKIIFAFFRFCSYL